jgi:hypothetical protein
MRHLVSRVLGLVGVVLAVAAMQATASAQVQATPQQGPPPGYKDPGKDPRRSKLREPIRTLILTGHNNHNWQYTSRVHAETLEATGRFIVDITDEPAAFMADANNLDPYDLIVVDYNDLGDPKRWGAAAEKNFEARIRLGAGLVTVHSANNAFPGWAQYERITCLSFREGKSGHDPFGPFELQVPGTNVISGNFPKKVEVTDELYYSLVPSGTRYATLAWAESPTTKKAEPLVITSEYGIARTANIALGHVWAWQPQTKYSVTSPFFRILLARTCEWAGANGCTIAQPWRDVRVHNRLTDAETKDGWRLLFDGTTTTGWRGFKSDKFPAEGWSVKGGELVHAPKAGGGDIVTGEEFGDFELSVDWMVGAGGNSGIIYRAGEDKDYPWQTGPECQILDDERHPDGKNRKTSAGSLYDVVEPPVDVVRPAGEWNTARVLCKGTHVEHWLNGFKVVDIDLASEAFKTAKAASKWKDSADYASRPSGHIALQDHGDEVRFRNVKIRKLDGTAK